MNPFPANWAQQLLDPQAFRDEQQRLAHVWTFLGITNDVARDNDWFRASIATRSVFVQRFGQELRGFENVCAHRFYPIRHDARGNGPVICGFHHWQYNRDGCVVGAPICKAVFGKLPHELGASLKPVELATCGAMIFGRFPSTATAPSLEEYLGDAFTILEAMTRIKERPMYMERSVRAHWKLNLHITLDDYHGPPVHATTLGVTATFPRWPCDATLRSAPTAPIFSEDANCFEDLLAGCRDGTYRSSHFFVFQICPASSSHMSMPTDRSGSATSCSTGHFTHRHELSKLVLFRAVCGGYFVGTARDAAGHGPDPAKDLSPLLQARRERRRVGL